MALGEVIATLVAVRGAIQTAIGLMADAGDEVNDAVGRAETALSGAGHDLADEGLSLWRQVQGDEQMSVQKLQAADDALADYLNILSPGSGTKNTQIAKPTGEELLKRSTGPGSKRKLRTVVGKFDQVDDGMKQLAKQKEAFEIKHPDFKPPAYVITEMGVKGPVMRAPDAPKVQVASGAMAVVATGIVVTVGTKKAMKVVGQIRDRWRGK